MNVKHNKRVLRHSLALEHLQKFLRLTGISTLFVVADYTLIAFAINSSVASTRSQGNSGLPKCP